LNKLKSLCKSKLNDIFAESNRIRQNINLKLIQFNEIKINLPAVVDICASAKLLIRCTTEIRRRLYENTQRRAERRRIEEKAGAQARPSRPGPGESERRAEIVERTLLCKLPAATRNRPEKPGN
jgi:hypothetical protein